MMQGTPEDPKPDPKPDDKPSYTPPQTQADLDRIIGERLAREREKTADYEDLKKKAEAHDAALEAQKTEAEKAIDAARSEGEKAATQRANERIIKAEARTLAATSKFRDPADAVAFLDLSKVTVNDDGDVDTAAITAQLTALATTKPYLVDDGKPGGKPRPDPTQGGGAGTDDKPSVARGRELYEAGKTKKSA